MNYVYYLILFVISGILIYIYIINYISNKINKLIEYVKSPSYEEYLNNILDNLISHEPKNNIDDEYYIDFMIVNGSFENSSMSRSLNGIQYINNIPTFIFFPKLKIEQYVTYGNINEILNRPDNNIINSSTGWIYGGYFIAASARSNHICSKGNDKNIKRLNNNDVILNYLYLDEASVTDNIIISNILYKSEEILLISITRIANNIYEKEFFNKHGVLLTYIKNEIIGNKKFIICVDSGLNSKYYNLILNTVFGDNVISSASDGGITYIPDKYMQSIYIVIDKRLCPNGIRFGVRYLEDEPSKLNLLLYAIIYNDKYSSNNFVEYYTDTLSLNIFKTIQNKTNYTDENNNWSKIDITDLDTNFQYDSNPLKEDTTTYTKQLLEDVI